LKKSHSILINFGTFISDTTGHQIAVQFPTSLNVCFCTTWEKENRQNVHQQKTINKKLYKISSFPICGHQQPINSRVTQLFVTARLLNTGLTFRNIDEFKKRLVKSGLV